MLEQSLQADLRTVVLRGLQGTSMNLEEAIGAAEMDDATAFNNMDVPVPQPTRRDTLADGMFEGLDERSIPGSVAGRIAMLVQAPAAVDDALASLLQYPDKDIQVRKQSY